jgi:hypothetical protein
VCTRVAQTVPCSLTFVLTCVLTCHAHGVLGLSQVVLLVLQTPARLYSLSMGNNCSPHYHVLGLSRLPFCPLACLLATSA